MNRTLPTRAIALVIPFLLTGRPAAAQELTLREALGAALASHPAVSAAAARIDAADAAVSGARAQRLPTVASSATLTRFQEPMLVAPLHAFDPTNIPDFDRALVRGEVGAQYTLFEGGGRSARIRGADAMAGAARWAAQATEAELIERVTSAYLGVLAARSVEEAAVQLVRALEAEHDRAGRHLNEGTAPRVEVLRARAALLDARAQASTAGARTELSVRTLARLMVVDPGEVERRALREVDLMGDASEGATHPLVERGRGVVAGARARVDQERAAFLPRVSASAGLLDYGTLGSDHVAEWQAGLRVSWPVFTGGARKASVRRAEAELRGAEDDLEMTRLEVASATDAADAALRESTARADALEAAVAQWEEVARIEALTVQEGAGVQSDLLRAQAGLYQARAGFARARYDSALWRVRLARARGTLDETWMDTALETAR